MVKPQQTWLLETDSSSDSSDLEDEEATTDAAPDRNNRRKLSTFMIEKVVVEPSLLKLEAYNVNFPKFAKPIIFNHKHYSKKFEATYVPTTRKGTKADVHALNRLFVDHLNCEEPTVYKDQTKADIERIIQKATTDDYSNVACLIIVVLTHGEENLLYAHDKKYENSMLWEPFTDKELRNPTLSGKPKLFFIQACRGHVLDAADDVVDARPSAVIEQVQRKIPVCANFFVSYSSFLGYMSVRNTLYGSWYIQTLCEVMTEFHNQLDLMSIMTVVKNYVAYNRTFDSTGEKQMPCTETTLTKLLYFHHKTAEARKAGPSAFPYLPTEVTDSRRSYQRTNSNEIDAGQQPGTSVGTCTSSKVPIIYLALGSITAILLHTFLTWMREMTVTCNCQCGQPPQ